MISIAALGLLTSVVGVSQAAAPAKKDAKPESRSISGAYDLVHQSVFRPAARAFDVPRLGRKITGHPRESANVDEQDHVRLPSTWWQPRIGFREVTVEQMLKGPGSGQGPAPGPWTVTKAKSAGVSAGFQIEDSKGDGFIIKFDPPKFPEMATGADVIGSYLFWAAGYNVPENTIEWFRRQDLKIGKDATYSDSRGAQASDHRRLSECLARAGGAAAGRELSVCRQPVPGWQADRPLPLFGTPQGRSRGT
jgi:hypothetical protein